MNILGVSADYHDASAALVSDGGLIACAAEERFSRQKHDPNFPRQAIEFCLENGNLSPDELDAIVFYEEPHIKFVRVLISSLSAFPRSRKAFVKSMKSWMGQKLWTKNVISRKMGIDPRKIIFIPHHVSHAAEAFLGSPFSESAILTVDAVGEWGATTLASGKREAPLEIRQHETLPYPHSLGLVYSVFTAFLGFRVNDGECSTMALAAFGRPRYAEEIRKMIRTQGDGTYRVDPSYFNFDQFTEIPFSQKFLDSFGEPRPYRESLTFDCFSKGDDGRKGITVEQQRYADIAASIQCVLEESLLALLGKLYKTSGSKNLCFAGGVALNCVANSSILKESRFERLFVPPDPGDGGGAIGAAFYAYHLLSGKSIAEGIQSPFLGKAYDMSTDMDMIRQMNPDSWIPYRRRDCPQVAGMKLDIKPYEDFQDLLDPVVSDLRNGKIVGWFQGRFEIGPRALGNRSILIDPSKIPLARKLSRKVKGRASFRPYALSVTEKDTKNVLEIPSPLPKPATWMQMTSKVKNDALPFVHAATHVDGTTRPQVCTEGSNPRFHQLLTSFGQAAGIAALLNTSYNESGFPIVASPVDALLSFARTDMDTLVIQNIVVRKIAP